jgi:hypothetical protein
LARWRKTFSARGFFLDKVGHYTAEGLIPIGLGVRADGGLRSIGGWTTLGALLAVVILWNKALNDAVHVTRAVSGLPLLADRDESVAPTVATVRRLRAAARFLPFHRAFHSVELTLLALLAAVGDLWLGDLAATRALLVILLPVAGLTAGGHLLAILTSARLR